MLLEYSIYLCRAVVSAMVAIYMIFVRTDSFILTKYQYAHVGVALAALLDMCMDIWGCSMIARGVEYFDFHWVWFLVYYVELTVLGFCVLKLVESNRRYFWILPLLIYYVLSDSREYRSRIDDNYAGSQNEAMHELSYCSASLFVVYLSLTVLDLLILDNRLLDAGLVALSTIVVIIISIAVFNLKPHTVGSVLLPDDLSDDVREDSDMQIPSNIEARVKAWESRYDKPYCNEDVSLFSVAEDLRVSPRVLSSYINSVRMVNFNTWINSLRVDEIRNILRDHPDSDVMDLMVASGFQSRSSLSRAVKNATGMTVSQLKERR